VEESTYTVIRSRKSALALNLTDFWKHRELLYFLVWKEVKIRYRQTVIGAGWAVLQPLLTTLVFTVIFGNFAHLPSDGIPYPLFIYSSMILWTYFSTAVVTSSNSLLANSSIITKVNFPRILLPFAACLVGLVDYVIALSILFPLLIYFNASISLAIFLIFIPLLMMFFLASGLGFWLSAINVKYRDVVFLVPFSVSLLMFISPIIYPLSLIGPTYQSLVMLNPIASVIATQRAILFGSAPMDPLYFASALIFMAAVFLGGMVYFKRKEREFADVI